MLHYNIKFLAIPVPVFAKWRILTRMFTPTTIRMAMEDTAMAPHRLTRRNRLRGRSCG